MRLTPQQIRTILDLVHELLGDKAQVQLFGSRTDDAAVGGDIDLLIELSEKTPLATEIMLSTKLEQRLGESVDLITTFPGQTSRPIVELARMTGIAL